MKTLVKLGLVIADDMEYLPVKDLSEKNAGKEQKFYSRMGHVFSLQEGGKTIEVHSVLSGIGKVNAASATMYLVQNGAEIIINFGLSGGISGVSQGDIVVGNTFLEHDFNLTVIGYAPAEKPGQDYVYHSDETYTKLFLNAIPGAKVGAMVSGDCFVCDNNLRDFLKTQWKAVACDMESAAVAYVASLSNIPFICVRQVSDDAGNDAYSDYKEMNEKAEMTLVEAVLSGINSLYSHTALWK